MGAALLWVPINTTAFRSIARDQTNNATGLFNLIRNEGSSIGVALTTAALMRQAQFHQSHLAAHVNLLNPAATGLLGQLPTKQGLARVYGEVLRQAMLMSYMDMFRLFAIASLAVIPFVLFVRRAVVQGKVEMAH